MAAVTLRGHEFPSAHGLESCISCGVIAVSATDSDERCPGPPRPITEPRRIELGFDSAHPGRVSITLGSERVYLTRVGANDFAVRLIALADKAAD